MEATVILLFIILSCLAGLIASLAIRKKTGKLNSDAAASYAEGLNLLLAGDQERALKKFRETVSGDSRNVDAYLKIGDILRSVGETERAINVHKYLTVRPGLTHKQRTEILQSLARDYEAAKHFEKALSVLDKVLQADKTAHWAREMKLSLFESMSDWSSAFRTYKELKSRNGGFSPRRLAIYKVREGLRLLDDGAEKNAIACFKEAIKINPEGPAGYIALADSYKRMAQQNDALKVLRQFVERVPKQSFLAFSRIKDLLYEGGVYGEIENVYQEIINLQPDNLMARLALAENYEKKGTVEKAIDECLEVLEKEPDNKVARKHLVKLYHKSGNHHKALEIALELIDESLTKKEASKFELSDFLAEANE